MGLGPAPARRLRVPRRCWPGWCGLGPARTRAPRAVPSRPAASWGPEL